VEYMCAQERQRERVHVCERVNVCEPVRVRAQVRTCVHMHVRVRALLRVHVHEHKGVPTSLCFQFVAACYSVKQRVAACCNMLQQYTHVFVCLRLCVHAV